MKVIVGLGNPGKEYEYTRHNIGWLALDEFAREQSAGRFQPEKTCLVAECRVGEEKVYLVKPMTYMNRSGQALSSWLAWMGEVRDAVREEVTAPERDPDTRGVHPSKQDKADDAECAWPGLVVVSDDVNLPLGRMRFRPAGSAGGHNGLTDVSKALGGHGYPRLRLGINPPPERMDRADYVTSRFAKSEAPVVERVTSAAARALRDWLRYGVDAVRNRYNGLDLSGES